MTTADPPEAVADAVLLAATAVRPRRRYAVGKIARQVSVLRRSPAEMFDKSLRKQMRLPVRTKSWLSERPVSAAIAAP